MLKTLSSINELCLILELKVGEGAKANTVVVNLGKRRPKIRMPLFLNLFPSFTSLLHIISKTSLLFSIFFNSWWENKTKIHASVIFFI